MALAFRNLTITPQAPVSQWPTEAVQTALERGEFASRIGTSPSRLSTCRTVMAMSIGGQAPRCLKRSYARAMSRKSLPEDNLATPDLA